MKRILSNCVRGLVPLFVILTGAPVLTAHPTGHHPLLLSPLRMEQLQATLQADEPCPAMERMVAYLDKCGVPADKRFLKDATDAQRYFLWRLPSVALHYKLTGDAASLQTCEDYFRLLLELPAFEDHVESGGGMGAANVLAGIGLAYDWVGADLDPALRQAFRKHLIEQVEKMYFQGFRAQYEGTHYWQQDPFNNHRWHRLAGLSLATLALEREEPLPPEFVQRLRDELDFVVMWLPDDGSTHESPSYLVFGMAHLILAVQAADEVLGTGYLSAPFFKSLGDMRRHTAVPGFADAFHYGDSGGFGGYNNAWYHLADIFKDGELQYAVDRIAENDPNAASIYWMTLVWRNPDLKPVPPKDSDDQLYVPDLGLALMRDTWDKDGVAAMFKCSLPGGIRMNEYRAAKNNGSVNIAHDDPDANSFTIWSQGEWVAETDRYSYRKLTSDHNTVLVNGHGQVPPGTEEGPHWFQPSPNGVDMTGMAKVTRYSSEGPVTIIEGDATGSYTIDPIERFRRTFLWKEGEYILVLDDLRAVDTADFTWLIQSGDVEETDAASGLYTLVKDGARCQLILESSVPLAGKLVSSTARDRYTDLGWRQLQASTGPVSKAYIACLILPWGGDGKLDAQFGSDGGTFRVTGAGGSDTWKWKAATGDDTASELKLAGTE